MHLTTKLRRGGPTHDDMKPDEQNQTEGLKPLPGAQCSVSWRIGQDGVAHGIHDCDPAASGWIAICGAFITGPVVINEPQCLLCLQMEKTPNKKLTDDEERAKEARIETLG